MFQAGLFSSHVMLLVVVAGVILLYTCWRVITPPDSLSKSEGLHHVKEMGQLYIHLATLPSPYRKYLESFSVLYLMVETTQVTAVNGNYHFVYEVWAILDREYLGGPNKEKCVLIIPKRSVYPERIDHSGGYMQYLQKTIQTYLDSSMGTVKLGRQLLS